MDEITDFLNDFSNKYPRSFFKIEEYAREIVENEGDVFTYKSKYLKEHVVRFGEVPGERMEYIPKEKVEPKSHDGMLNATLFDFDQIRYDLGKDFYDIEEWCINRFEIEIKEIRNFLFQCNAFRAIFFLESLYSELEIIENDINKMWDSFKPNWFQEELTDMLKFYLSCLITTIEEDVSKIYPNIIKGKKNDKILLNRHEDKNWYKIAELMAEGVIDIKRNYLFKGKTILQEKEMSELVSSHLNNEVSAGGIKPYLSRTKSHAEDDKNIFRAFRIDTLKIIAANTMKKGKLSKFYSGRMDELKLKL